MATIEKTVIELLAELHNNKWTDKAIGAELGITGYTAHRWRRGRVAPQLPKLVRAKLEEILGR